MGPYILKLNPAKSAINQRNKDTKYMSKKLLLVLFVMTTSTIAQSIVTDSISRSITDSTSNSTPIAKSSLSTTVAPTITACVREK